MSNTIKDQLHLLDLDEEPKTQPKPKFSRGAQKAAQQEEASSSVETILDKPNRYSGRCEACGTFVGANKGLLVKKSHDNWGVQHQVGQCPSIGQPGVEPEPAEFALPDGRYTAVWYVDDQRVHRTIQFKHQDEFDDFMPGAVIMSFFERGDYVRFGHINRYTGYPKLWRKFSENQALIKAVKVILGNKKESAVEYARQSGRCFRCNRELTEPDSLARGAGPECWEKLS